VLRVRPASPAAQRVRAQLALAVLAAQLALAVLAAQLALLLGQRV
jgi:hypothetical protein